MIGAAECVVIGSGALGASVAFHLARGGRQVALIDKHALGSQTSPRASASPPAGTERLSVAFFLGAKLDATVPVLDLPPHLAAEARGVTQDPQNPLFMEVGRNYLKSRLRSHPDVAKAHYADLLTAEELQRVGPGSAY